jgi:hypothetical protein
MDCISLLRRAGAHAARQHTTHSASIAHLTGDRFRIVSGNVIRCLEFVLLVP